MKIIILDDKDGCSMAITLMHYSNALLYNLL